MMWRRKKPYDIRKVDNGLGIIALDKGSKESEEFLKCVVPKCKKKAVIHLAIPVKISQFKVQDEVFAICRDHLERLYKEGVCCYINDVHHLKLIEGIIEYGTLEAWLDRDKEKHD